MSALEFEGRSELLRLEEIKNKLGDEENRKGPRADRFVLVLTWEELQTLQNFLYVSLERAAMDILMEGITSKDDRD